MWKHHCLLEIHRSAENICCNARKKKPQTPLFVIAGRNWISPQQCYIEFWQEIYIYTLTNFDWHKNRNLTTIWSAVHTSIRCYEERQKKNDEDFSQNILFSETHSHLGGFVNKDNCRIWDDQNPSKIVEKLLHLPKGHHLLARSLGRIASKMMLGILLRWQVIDTMIYQCFISRIECFRCLEDLWYEQDGAICHTANATMPLSSHIISRNYKINWPPVIVRRDPEA